MTQANPPSGDPPVPPKPPGKPAYQGGPTERPTGPPAGSPPAGRAAAAKPQVQKPQYSGSGPDTTSPVSATAASPSPAGDPPAAGGAPPAAATSTADFTDEEKKSIKNAAFGALFLVTRAEPGFFDTIKESFAASKALAGTTGPVREILTTGGMAKVPRVPPGQLEQTVLPQLSQAMTLVHTKDPQELDAFRSAIIGACERVANAAGGASETETAAIQKISAAMGL